MLVLFWRKLEQTLTMLSKQLVSLSDINDFVPFNEVYATAFKADFPARSAVERRRQRC